MQAKKKLLVITHGMPHPIRGASSVLFFLYIKALKSLGHTIIHLGLESDRTEVNQDFKEYVDAIGISRDFRVIREDMSFSHAFSYRTLSIEPVLPHANTVKEILNFNPDTTVCFDIVAAAVAKKMGLQNLQIWLGDLAYQTGLYHAVYDAAENPSRMLKLPRALLNSTVWKRFYRKTLKGQVKVVVSSKSTEKRINSLGAQSIYLPYPWPGAAEISAPQAKLAMPTFIMFGTLAALGSKSAFHFLLKNVYPLLINKWGENGFQILIAGSRELPQWVRAEVEGCPSLRFLGFVEDLAALVSQCHAVLAPISVPVGNRSRIVTAMSMGSLVIAHKNTALGNPELISGENCLLAGSAKDFAMCMFQSFDSLEEAEKMGCAARLKYLETFQPDMATQKFLQFLELDMVA